jgi:hypothetical protein
MRAALGRHRVFIPEKVPAPQNLIDRDFRAAAPE